MIALDIVPFLKDMSKKLLLQNEIKGLETVLGKVKWLSFENKHWNTQFIYANKTLGICPIEDEIDQEYYDDFIEVLDKVYGVQDVIDYREAAEEEIYLQGAKSIVVDAKNELAFCGVNNLSDESLFIEFCEDFEWTPITFSLEDDRSTNSMFWMNNELALVCLDLITDKKEKKQVISQVKQSGRQLIAITKEQVESQVLNLVSANNTLVINQKSYDLLTTDQLSKIEVVQKIKPIKTPVIDDLGLDYKSLIFKS